MKIPLLRNTLTNYILIALKLAEGFLLVRWMIAMMGMDLYGLWCLLWSFLMYSALVDFGFGPTIKKYTARGLYQEDLAHYNRIASTLFTLCAVMTLPILAGTAAAVWQAPVLFKLPAADSEMVALARRALVIFGVGSAVNFPLTMFGSMMIGLQRQYIHNTVNAIMKLVEFAAVCVVFFSGAAPHTAFYALLATVVVIPVIVNVCVGVAVFRCIPGLNLVGGFDRDAFREVFSFSGWMYAGAVVQLALNTASPVIVGAMSGLMVAGVFQVGRKFPQIMLQLTSPYQENTSPLAARLWAHGRRRALGAVMLGFMRWNAFLSTALSLLVFTLAPELIRFFFRVDIPETVAVCRVFTVSMWLLVVASTVPQAAFLMVERHRFQICVSTVAAVLTIALTVLALRLYPGSALAVTVAALVVQAILSFGAHLPMMSRVTGMSVSSIFVRTVGTALTAALPSMLAARYAADGFGTGDFSRLVFGTLFGLGTFLPFGASLLFTRREMDRATDRFRARFRRKGT